MNPEDLVKVRPYKQFSRRGESSCEALMLTEGKHAGIIFSYGKVSFEEDKENETLRMHFEYEVHDKNDVEYDKKEFEDELSDFLHELMLYNLAKNEITYTGGVDEDRENDPKQSNL